MLTLRRPLPARLALAGPLRPLLATLALLLPLLGLATAAQAQRPATFGAVATPSTGSISMPYGIAAADVNGDGQLDIVTANSNRNTMGVLLGTGTGGFGAVTAFSAGGTPYDVAVADVNGDGRLDILTANFNGNTAGVLLGTGTGSFGAMSTFSTGSGTTPSAIAVADVNGDGRLDILTANFNGGAAGVLLGTGTGSFGAVSTFSTGSGSHPADIAVADVNGDGKLDIVTANYYDNTVGVLLGTGTGSFGAVSTFSTGSGSVPLAIAVADINGDGNPDLLTANYGTNTAGVLLGTGTGSFGAVSTVSTGSNSGPIAMAVADVNGDGRPDLLTANNGNNTAGVLLNTTPVPATRTFLPVTTTNSGGRSYGVAVADVNGDGQPDLLTANYSSTTVGVQLGTGTGTFGAVSTFATGGLTRAIAVGDVNRDGKPDLLVALNSISNNSVGVLLGTGTGSFGAATIFSAGADSAPRGLAVADVNGDGKLDVLTANLFSNTVGVLLGTGTGSFGAVTAFSTGSGSTPYDIAVADVNGDGKLDALTVNAGSDAAGVLLGTGTGSFGAITAFSLGNGSNPYALAVADVNGDGQLDLLTANSNSTAGVLLGMGTGSFGAATTFSAGTSSLPIDIAVADVNGDGKPDIITANNISNTTGVLLGGLDLVVSTTTGIYADALYNSFTVTSTGVGTLASPINVAGSTTVQSGGVLNDGCFVLSGPGSFTLAAGGTLGICAAQGISSSGATGSIQVTGTRTFDPDARYTYNGSAAQVTGSGLPATVRTLTLGNSAGLTLTDDVTATSAATLTGGVLRTGSNALTLGPAATLAEDADGYVTGTVQTTRNLSTAGSTQSFGGLGLTLTPSGSRLPGSTLVVRTTGTARTGAGTSQSVRRVFDIQPTVKTGLNVALALTVRDDERNSIPAANLRLFKSDNAGSTWQRQAAATIATTAASGSQPTTYTASLSGISSFSLWTLGNAANPLPVELVQLTATASGPAAVRLAWATASEVSSAAFEVQRSADGTAWTTIGTVAAAGSSATMRQYTYLDSTALAGTSYYRLRHVDLDGTFSYSPVRAVTLGTGGLALYPNPAPHGAATFTGATPGQAVQVLDALGRVAATATVGDDGTAVLDGLASGLYLVRAGTATGRLAVE